MIESVGIQKAEEVRVAALRSLGILDSERDPGFDQVVELAAAICNTPISSFTLIDATRGWLKASVGVGIRETDRELSFCSHTIQQPGLMIVEDATKDPRFADNPWVVGEGSIRFYAGVPLAGPDGHMLGTLCVADTVPRQLTAVQVSALEILAAQLKTRIELGVERQKLQQVAAERERLIEAMQSSEHRFRTFMNNSPFLSYIRDEAGRFTFYSEQVAERFGVDTSEWMGKTFEELFPPEYAKAYRKTDRDALQAHTPIRADEEAVDKSGHVTFWRSFKFRFEDEHGHPMVGGVSVDITDEIIRSRELERKTALLERFALTDSLTGLANRRAADEQVRLEVEGAVQTGKALSVILLDVDNFKLRNDQHGHSAGDEILRSLGVLLAGEVRSTDLPSRYGGEEFLIILPDTDLEQARTTAERIRSSLCAVRWQHGLVTASFGVASLQCGQTDPVALVAQADQAMYQAKHGGKNRVVVFSQGSASGQRRAKKQAAANVAKMLDADTGAGGVPAKGSAYGARFSHW